jgi:hypothetical protein
LRETVRALRTTSSLLAAATAVAAAHALGTSDGLGIPAGQRISACVSDGAHRARPQTLLATGGAPRGRYRWAPSEGALPAGIALDEVTGVIYGTGARPARGVHLFAVSASDGSDTALGWVIFEVTRGDAGCPTAPLQGPAREVVRLLPARAGSPYGSSLLALGGTPPYAWREDCSFGEGTLAEVGLTLSPQGVLYGTPLPSARGQLVRFRAQVEDGGGEVLHGPIYEVEIR